MGSKDDKNPYPMGVPRFDSHANYKCALAYQRSPRYVEYRKKRTPKAEWVWHKRLRTLPVYPEVYERVCKGFVPNEIADWLRNQGHCTDITKRSLTRAIQRLRKDIPDADLATALDTTHKDAVKRMDEGLDVLEELEHLYQIQSSRVAIDYGIEKKLGKLMKNTHKEVREAREILNAYHQVQADLGLVKRNLGQLEVKQTDRMEIAVEHGDRAAEIVKDPSSVDRVLRLMDNVKHMISLDADDGDVIDVVAEESEDAS